MLRQADCQIDLRHVELPRQLHRLQGGFGEFQQIMRHYAINLMVPQNQHNYCVAKPMLQYVGYVGGDQSMQSGLH